MRKEWPRFKSDKSNSGFFPFEIAKIADKEVSRKPWSFQTGGLVWGSPIIDDKENIYAGSSNGFFYAIDKNGNIIWKYKIEDSPDGLIDSAACFAGDDKVVIPGGDGFLHCVEKSTGRRLWVFKAYHSDDSEHHKGTHVNSFEGNAVFENGIIYAGSDNGYFYAVDIEGNEKWSFKTGMMIWSAPVFGLENKWMAFGSLDNHIYFVNPESGKLLAKKKLDGAVKSSPCFDPRSSLLFACTSNGAVYCFSIAGLAGNDVNEWTLKISLKWKKKFIGEIYSSPSFHENKLVFGTSRGRLYCLNFHGKKEWKYRAGAGIFSSPVISADKKVIFGVRSGMLHCVDFETGEMIWQYESSGRRFKSNLDSSPSVSSSGLICNGSYDGSIYCIPYEAAASNFSGISGDAEKNQGIFLDIEDPSGNAIDGDYKIPSLYSPISLKISRMKKGMLEGNASISPIRLSAWTTPKIEIEKRVSSDGKYLYIIPKEQWKPGVEYKLHVSFTCFKRARWIVSNAVRALGGKIVEREFNLKSPAEEKSESARPRMFEFNSLFLFSHKALESYIAAALYRQSFTAEIIPEDEDRGKLKILLQNSSEKGEGMRKGQLEGEFTGDHFRVKGQMSISAMGGSFLFKDVYLAGRFSDYENENDAVFIYNVPISKIKANKQSFSFPSAVLGDMVDYRLGIIGSMQAKVKRIRGIAEK